MAKGNPYNLLESGSLSLFAEDLSELHSDIVAENQRANQQQEEIELSGIKSILSGLWNILCQSFEDFGNFTNSNLKNGVIVK